MDNWSPGYSSDELDDAQERYNVRFPPDLIGLLRERQPRQGYDWKTENSHIRRMLDWPLQTLTRDVETGTWWPAWGIRPECALERREVVSIALSKAPRLIPIMSHRFIPESPGEAGNPVFSMYGFDTIYYGADLNEFFRRQFEGYGEVGKTRHISFWSDLIDWYWAD